MAHTAYTNFKLALGAKLIDLDTDTIKVMLTAGYTPDPDHVYVTASGAGAAEISVTGYTGGYGGGGRKPLTGVTWTANNTINKSVLDADDVTWASLAAGATPTRALLIIEQGGSDATAILLGAVDIGSSPTAGAPYTITWSTDGVLRW
jgi:hypothetical protein